MDYDLLLRGGALSVLALLACILWRGGGAQRLLAFSCACGCAYLFSSSPALAQALGPVSWLVHALAATGPFWFLMATRRAFGAPARLKMATLGLIAACIALLAISPNFASGTARFSLSMMADTALLLLFGAALYTAWHGLADDLDPRRRSLRLTLLGASACFSVLVAGAALWANVAGLRGADRAMLDTVISGGALAVTWSYCALAMRLAAPARPEKAPSSANTSLANKIVSAFEADKLHRRPDLTLSVLARAIETPEHQVRVAINTDLGCRNFSAFVNKYRLDEVKHALADRAQVDVPITTIALDAGFGSIASFNRVFKAATGVAPSEFRRSALGN